MLLNEQHAMKFKLKKYVLSPSGGRQPLNRLVTPDRITGEKGGAVEIVIH
jgi:hypothetical protein